MMRNTHHPIRTCIGCRKRRPFGEMISLAHGRQGEMCIAAIGGVRRPEVTGRTLHCCPNHTCMGKALQSPGRRGKASASSQRFECLVDELEAMLTTWRQRRIQGLDRRGLGLNDQHLLAWKAISIEFNDSMVVTSQGA